MSFNIRYGTADDGENSWPYRKGLVVKRIQEFAPDLLGLQECRNDSQADYLKSKLKDYHFIGVERGGDNESALEMTPLLVKRTALDVLESGCFWLSTTPNISGSIGWGNELPRLVTWAKVEAREARGIPILFLNAHFDHMSTPAQAESALFLRKYISALGPQVPVILCGDFNTTKDTVPYYTLTSSVPGFRGLLDTYREARSDWRQGEGTFHGFGEFTDFLAIDWILVSNHFIVEEARIDKFVNGEQYPSDHYPLLARVRMDRIKSNTWLFLSQVQSER